MAEKAAVQVLRESLDVVVTCDPAISEKSAACRTAITVVGMSPIKQLFLLEYWVGRQGDPAKIIDQILQMAEFWQPRVIGIESVAFQQALEPYIKREMEQRNIWHPIIMLKPDRNEKKDQRILSMQPYFRSGQVFIQHGMFEFIEEYETFPLGRTRDILDAMSYAFRLLVPRASNAPSTLKYQLKDLEKRDPASAQYWRKDAIRRGLIEEEEDLEDLLDGLTEERYEAGVGDLV